MEGDYKLVNYDQYCERCVHRNTEDKDDPCDECLENPAMPDSHKPMHFKEK